MLFAIVPAAPPTRKNQRTTSCPAPLYAKVPYQRGSRLIFSAFVCVSIVSSSFFMSQQNQAYLPSLEYSNSVSTSAKQSAVWSGRQNRSKICTKNCKRQPVCH